MTEEQAVESPSRRKVLKKAAYVTPALITLGVLSPINSAHAWSVPPPPNDPRFNDPRFPHLTKENND